MATQGEGDKGTRSVPAPSHVDGNEHPQGGSSNLAPSELRYELYGSDDPYRSERIASLTRETGTFLQEMGKGFSGLPDLDAGEYQRFQRDAEERARWSQSTKNVFQGIVRLANRAPSRANRIL